MKTEKPLTVFAGLKRGRGRPQVRTIVATSTKKRAADLLGISAGELSKDWSVTGNKAELATALEHPEVVFQASGPWSNDFVALAADA